MKAHLFRTPCFGAAVPLMLLTCLVCLPATAQVAEYQSDPGGFVRKAIQNELEQHNDRALYAWKQVSKRPKGEFTKLMVETKECVISRYVAFNGQPLSPEDRVKDDARVGQLLRSGDALREKKKEQQEDSARVLRALRAIPDAFLFHFAGTEDDSGRTLVHYTFEPNPNFRPPSREAMVFQGLKGDLFIDVRAARLAKIDATLFRDVPFGWGILGRLNKGGHFLIEQQQVGPDRWDITHSVLSFTGKILLFRSLNMQQEETLSDFRRVPDALTIAQGIEYLKKADGHLAENQAKGGNQTDASRR